MSQTDRAEKSPQLEKLIEAGLSCREVAARLGLSVATAIRWTKRAGLVSSKSRRLSEETRAAIREATREGLSAAEAAARFGVSAETARRLSGRTREERQRLRQQVLEAIAAGFSRREAALQVGVSAATAIRWASEADRGAGKSAATRQRRAQEKAQTTQRRQQRTSEREDQRGRLLAAVASGLSRRQAAALVGLPVATAIRWVQRETPKISPRSKS